MYWLRCGPQWGAGRLEAGCTFGVNKDSEDDVGEPNELDRARRHFLKAAAYTAPAVLATITLNKAHAQASCNPSTCMPGVCNPNDCMPLSCNPLGG